MEILYLWIQDYKGISNLGINLSNRYTFEFDQQSQVITVSENKDYEEVFWGNNVTNLTALVGKNGVGKTSIIKFMIEFLSDGIKETNHEAIVIYSQNNEHYLFTTSNSYTEIKLKGLLCTKSNKIEDITKNLYLLFLSNHLDSTSVFNLTPNWEQKQMDHFYNLSTTFLLSAFIEDLDNPNLNTKPFAQQFMDFATTELARIINLILESSLLSESSTSFYSVNIPQYLNIKLNRSILSNYNKLEGELSESILSKSDNFDEFMFDYFCISLINFAKQKIGPKEIKGNQFESENEYQSRVNAELIKIYDKINEIYKLNQSLNLLQIVREWCKAYGLVFLYHDTYRTLRYFTAIKSICNINKDIISLKISNISKNSSETKFLISANTNDNTSLYLSHKPFGESSLSSGEYLILSLFARINTIFEEKITIYGNVKSNFSNSSSFLILIDEAELGLHPQWQKNFINNLLDFINKRFVTHKVQIVLTSHSPFILSDIPKDCAILLDRNENNQVSVKHLEKSHNSFGANIHELFTDSFFLQDGLMGEFARSKINNLIIEINNEKEGISLERYKNEYQKKINIIGEPFLRKKITELIISKSNNNSQIIDSIIEDRENEIEKLKRLRGNNR